MNEEDLLLIQPPRIWSKGQTPPRRELLWIKEGKKCHWCGRTTRLVNDNSWDKATTDHVIPQYKGGTSDPENLVSACMRCNNRRCHEDQRGLPEGSLLGKYKETAGKPRPHQKKKARVALSGDEKRAVLAKLPAKQGHLAEVEVVRLQRDQALQTILKLRTEMKRREEAAAGLEQRLKTMTVGQLIRQKLAEWLRPKES
jgi:hypothetical protein